MLLYLRIVQPRVYVSFLLKYVKCKHTKKIQKIKTKTHYVLYDSASMHTQTQNVLRYCIYTRMIYLVGKRGLSMRCVRD